MVEVYAVGRIMQRRQVVGYKLLNLEDMSLKIYSLDNIRHLLKSGNTIGNLYLNGEEIEEYFCSRTLTEYSQNGKRIGKARDTFLTVYTDSCSASVSHYHSSEVYFSGDELIEIKDLLNLNYIEHYDVEDLDECLPFVNNSPIDMYVKNFQGYYSKLNHSSKCIPGFSQSLNNMGILRCALKEPVDTISIEFCRALESISLLEDGDLNELVITDACGALLPNSITRMNLDKVIVGKTSVCSNAFKHCNIEMVDLKNIGRNSKDDIFKNCKVNHLVLPKWYDSWEILNCFEDMIQKLEITNTACSNSVWEIEVKDKLWFRKVETLLLPIDFDYEQEKSLREELTDVKVIRKTS